MYNTGQTQSIVLSGVANAGKSTALQHILTFLTAKSALMMDYVEQWNSDAGPDDERFKLLRKHDATLEHCLSTSIDTIVNAFASAATNGSRSTSLYGSYFSLYYDEVGVIDGAKLDILHFERSRIARLFSQNGNTTNDANFHVFYYFLAGLDKAAMQKWMLPSVETSAYRLLTPSTSSTAYARRDLSSDRKMWTRLEQELDQCKFGNQRKDSIYAMLAAILHLGNIEFTATPSGGVVLGETSRSHVRCAATLLQVGEGTLHKALSSKRIKMTDDSRTVTMEKQLTAEESKETCDDIACFLYECLFQFIVDTINDAVRPSSADLPRLGILHLPGFTDRSAGAGNGFDEFLRNTLDEVVRGLECFHIIREQQNYEEDGIMWEHVDIADNRDCLSALLGTGAVDLLAGDAASSDTKTTGILQMVRDGTTVNQVAMQILATLSDNKAIDIEQSLEFTVHHTSGSATYATKPFLSNRYARISPEVSVPFLESELEMVRGWFRDASKKASVSARFISAVQSMLSSIARDNILFVHCIQPNREKQPGYVDSEYMWQQLR